MANFQLKNSSSRIVRPQVLNWTGAGTLLSTTFLNGTSQIRVIAQTAGFVSVINTTADATTPTTAAATGMFIAAATGTGDWLTVTAGQILAYASTTTSTANPIVSVTEMA